MAVTLIICGLILMALGTVCIFYLDHEVVGVIGFILALVCMGFGVSMTPGNEPKKCTCEEAIQVETCEDCGGIVE